MPTSPTSPWAERRPEKQTITVEEFREALGEHSRSFAQVVNALAQSNVEAWSQRQLVQLYRGATEIETLLDDHGARRNQVFFRPREVLAIVRWLVAGLSSLAHLHARLPFYEVADLAWAREEMSPRVEAATLRLGAMLGASLRGVKAEWLAAGVSWPDTATPAEALSPMDGLVQLPNDRLIGEDQDPAEEQDGLSGARLAHRLLGLLETWTSQAGKRFESLDEKRQFMANFCSEEIARRYEARVHNIQSSYDTRIAGSAEELENPQLKQIRGTASQVLHLLEMVTALTHLYERHDIYERAGESRALFESLLDESELLDLVIHEGVGLAYSCLQRAESMAQGLREQLVTESEVQVELPDGVAMHARPLSMIVGIVQKHGTPVELEVAGETCSAASMMQMLVLIGTYAQERSYIFRGEARALADLQLLFEHRLGENGTEGFPAQLGYLRR